LAGTLYGPLCDFARTLPSEYAVKAHKIAPSGTMIARVLVTEPCYWTRDLPFQYKLSLQWRDPAGRSCQAEQMVGMRRLSPRGESLFWDSKRVVLRGAAIKALRKDMVDEIRAAGTALIAPFPSAEQCDLADRSGISLIADLRDDSIDFDEHLMRLSGRPCVTMLLIHGGQIRECDLSLIAPQVNIACAVYPDDFPRFCDDWSVPPWCNIVLVELESKPLPPEALPLWKRPVIALRSGVPFPDFHEARAACDRLQADLAPEFNLAGYFVSHQ
jgi:hypothetical protein